MELIYCLEIALRRNANDNHVFEKHLLNKYRPFRLKNPIKVSNCVLSSTCKLVNIVSFIGEEL